jgi:hypothetical protein
MTDEPTGTDATTIETPHPIMRAPDVSTPHRTFWKLKGVGPDNRTPVYEEVIHDPEQ